MPGRRTSSKHLGKPSRQLLVSQALRHQRVPPTEEHFLTPNSSMAESAQGTTMDRILLEISAVGRKLEAGREIWLIRTRQDVDHQKWSVKRLLRPEDLRVFLDGLQHQTQSMDTASLARPQDPLGPLLGVASSASAPEDTGRPTTDSHPRGRDLERLTKSYDDRGQVLQAVAMHTQIADRDNSHSPLKPTLTPT
ncbi:hypothetical protein NDU88_002470 [Pleurodeles waltl]|uniref:Uncharacterized protein n=1 Tax=Pleurodeles waltl TaxID=8319 RepID=A0AAV7VCP5_PLEWA|nr:hypothetical protein NDU88_002470 [Pleurodeles waltl]